MVILYVETNFLMAIAKGQDLEAKELLRSVPPSIHRIVIPEICYIEALNRWKKEKYYADEFEKELNKQINNSSRDLASPHAKSFLTSLEQTLILNQALLNDIQVRLFEYIDLLIQTAKVEEIKLDTTIIRNISKAVILQPDTLIIKRDLMDNLILHCIISHAKSYYSTQKKVFLSGNSKDFGKPEVIKILETAGIEKYFTNTNNFLGWLNSQSS
ncbi:MULTISPECIES: PIN domain-containing protein [Calothrix]|uniref:DUF4935 domain-containing protein n=2 Tax=Calothrix TaxID=1186 RepID=A0ABR8AFD5_9CYAN|nr:MULTISPECIES: PIN domain-containing protein [Calothrix]MBD2197257.1 DUF4935 domain-containing protein [Calothrix parietina FACHB-288]MBD2225910.1 DUF4935 domain-containing protein [Calothrix anomala FACHB-343]